ncbi:Meiosis-specific nuclear structural protein 1 [Phytophthora citrophthora]|uniref:Meiosis-specific nuclear structural protein 1 n=1 Tax=Phytophthora citrophthora TaxID=4793 RepID=A0AAD9GBR2_9STRA|nr:Meiosis-specific nuclear structural protein 1 [Phytophthora citrophthora]
MAFPYPVNTRMTARNVDKVQFERRRQEMDHNALYKFAQGNQLQALQNQSDANVASRRRTNHAAQLSAERMLEENHARKISEQQRAARERQQNEALAHTLETTKKAQEQKELEVQRICEASEELRELEMFLKTAYMNKERATQQLERETLAALDRQREVAIEQQMEYDRQRSLVEMHNQELRKRVEAEQGKHVLQTQMLQRQELRREAQLEADFERMKIEKLMQQVEQEDAAELARREKSREQTREMIDQTHRERELMKQQQVESARREDEAIADYRRRVEAREADIKAASEVKKAQEDAMFRAVEAEIQAKMREDEEIERLRDELWEEELLQKKRAQEEEKIAAKLQAKEDMMRSNEMQMLLKQELLARQRADEEAFNEMLKERFRSEERREMELATFRRKQREQFVDEIARHRALKQEMVYAELQRERRERERQEQDENYRRQVVEAAKQRLLREHADVLQGYLPRALRPSSSSFSGVSIFR